MWNEDFEDREVFLSKFIELLDISDYYLIFIRKKELVDYR